MWIDPRSYYGGNNYEEVSLSDTGGEIYQNWINTDTAYLPSGMRSKGFKIDFQFIKEFIKDVKEKFGKIPVDRLVENLNEDKLIKYFNMYIISYFGVEYNETKRIYIIFKSFIKLVFC